MIFMHDIQQLQRDHFIAETLHLKDFKCCKFVIMSSSKSIFRPQIKSSESPLKWVNVRSHQTFSYTLCIQKSVHSACHYHPVYM